MTDKKGQSALEFVMTYGWAIMAFLVSIAALFYFGVIPGDITGASVCALSPGINCLEYKVSALGVTLVLQNSFPYTLTSVAANITNTDQGPCFESAEKVLFEGRSETFFVRCDNIKKDKFKGDIVVRYRKEGGIQRSFSGALSTPVILSKNASDITAPVVILSRPGNGFNYTGLEFNLVYNVSDASSVICWYVLDNGPEVNIPDCDDIAVNSLVAGTHTIKVYSRDENGNQGSAQALFYTNNYTSNYDQLSGSPGCVDSDSDLYFLINASCPQANDCDDNNANINPGAAENTAVTCSDGVDNNCNGKVDANDISVVPPGEPTCYYNFGASQFGGCDYDGDTYGTNDTSVSCFDAGTGDDCNDFNASINPGASEVCNGVDDNCNGQVDEGVCNTVPTLLGSYITSNPAAGIYYLSNNVYLATTNSVGDNLFKISVSNPVSPSLLLSKTMGGQNYQRLFIDSANYLYAIGDFGSPGFRIFDTSALNSVANDANSGAYINVQGNLAYPGGVSNILNIENVTDKSNINTVSSYLKVVDGVNPSFVKVQDSRVVSDTLYVVGAYLGLLDIDSVNISDISSPTKISTTTLSFSGNAGGSPSNAMSVVGNYAYVSGAADGFYIVDISNPANMVVVGSYNTPGTSTDIYATSENIAYVADGGRGLLIFDVSNKASPRPIGQYCAPGPGNVARLYINGRTAYISVSAPGGFYGLRIVDLSYLNTQPWSTISFGACSASGGGSSPIFVKGGG